MARIDDEATRYQLRLRGAAKDALDDMVKKLGSTPKDVILDALGFFSFAVEATEQGLDIGSYDPREGRFTAIVTPSLSGLRRRRTRTQPLSAAE